MVINKSTAVWGGYCSSDLVIDDLPRSFHCYGRVAGSVTANGEIDGSLVFGTSQQHPTVDYDIVLGKKSRVRANLAVNSGGSDSVIVEGTIEGNLSLQAEVGDLRIGDNATIRRDVLLHHVRNRALIVGTVHGDLKVAHGQVCHHLQLTDKATVLGHVEIRGQVDKASIAGSLGRVTLKPSHPLEIERVRCRTDGPLIVGEDCSLANCDFRDFDDYNQLRLTGGRLFEIGSDGRQVISRRFDKSFTEVANEYRQIRHSMEGQSNRSGASDFYFHECEARRSAAFQASLDKNLGLRRRAVRAGEASLLWIYKFISHYGTRPLRPLLLFVATAILGTALFAIGGVNLGQGGLFERRFDCCWTWNDRFELLAFSLKSMLSVFRPPQGSLSVAEEYLQLGLRILGPLLAAQFVLSLRERVAR